MANPNIFTRKTDPHNPERVAYILDSVVIGETLSTGERTIVQGLIAQNADAFACTLSEVLQIPGAKHNLNVPPDVKFSAKLNQRPMNPPQKQFMHKWTDQMRDADMVEPAIVERIQHVAPTVLTQKTH
ncbi:hypothetical protein HYDPIDRAFT_85587, partial [Hydnomerulius pinastri MD-312]